MSARAEESGRAYHPIVPNATESRNGDPLVAAGRLALTIATGITPDDYAKPTPCDQWDVRGVLNAMVIKADLFASAVDEPATAKPEPWPDVLGEDPQETVRVAVDGVVACYAQADQDRTVVLPLGEVSWSVARGVVMIDLTLHAWDLAIATGQPLEPPPHLVATCLGIARAVVNDDLRDHGDFKAALGESNDASDLERLLAVTGRSPDFNPPT